jgi:hypothetical protein
LQLYFAFAVALAFLFVIPAGDLLLHSHRKINLKTEENFRLPATWSLRTSEGTPITTNPPRKNHVLPPQETPNPQQKRLLHHK